MRTTVNEVEFGAHDKWRYTKIELVDYGINIYRLYGPNSTNNIPHILITACTEEENKEAMTKLQAIVDKMNEGVGALVVL